jgi:spore maturation protein CgeB
MPVEIPYVGPNEGTSRQRFEALRRLGHSVFMVDPFDAVSSNRYARSWIFHTGALGCERSVQSFVTASVGDRRLDLALVDSGELIGPALVEQLRGRSGTVVNFNQDNPYAAKRRFRLFRKALPFYDLIVTSRDSSVQAARAGHAEG